MKIIRTARCTALLLISLAVSASALAQSGDEAKGAAGAPSSEQSQRMAARMAERFKTADTDHDGKLTLEEAKAGMPMVARNFDKIDTGHTGSVTLEQVAASARQMRRN
jgi:Ca2+-binding EF-hand superfamily protein